MALTDIATIEAILGRSLSAQSARVNILIELASGLVSEVMGYTVDPNPIPGEVSAITTGVVARALINPTGAIQETAGPFSTTHARREALGIYLVDDERRRLSRIGGRSLLWTLGTTRGDALETRWVYDQLHGDPIPFETTS